MSSSSLEAYEPLLDLTVLGLIIAHGSDGELDPRETGAITDQLHAMGPSVLGFELSGEDAIDLVQEAALRYRDVKIEELDGLVRRVAFALDGPRLVQAYHALCAVAAADGVAHPMESTILRHLREAWDLPAPDG